jgi:hypothetical protein
MFWEVGHGLPAVLDTGRYPAIGQDEKGRSNSAGVR